MFVACGNNPGHAHVSRRRLLHSQSLREHLDFVKAPVRNGVAIDEVDERADRAISRLENSASNCRPIAVQTGRFLNITTLSRRSAANSEAELIARNILRIFYENI